MRNWRWIDTLPSHIQRSLVKIQLEEPDEVLCQSMADLPKTLNLSPKDVAYLIQSASHHLYPIPSRARCALSMFRGGGGGDNSSDDIFQRRRRLRLSTGCPRLDEFLKGGIPVSCITEIFGESSTGKTQMALQLCLTAQWVPRDGGLGAGAVYIATEQSFPLDRFQELSRVLESRGRPTPLGGSYADHVHIIHLRDLEVQRHIIDYQLPALLELHRDIGLVVIDSVAANFRGGGDFDSMDPLASLSSSYGGLVKGQGGSDNSSNNNNNNDNSNLSNRMHQNHQNQSPFQQSAAVFALAQSLKKTADRFSVAVVCVNQVSKDVRDASRMSFSALTKYNSNNNNTHHHHHEVSERAALVQATDPGSVETGCRGGSSGVIPTLGLAWTSAVNVRIKLSKGSRRLGAAHIETQGPWCEEGAGGDKGCESGGGGGGGGVRELSPIIRNMTLVFAPHLSTETCHFVVQRDGIKRVLL